MTTLIFAGMMAMLSPAQNRLPPPRMEFRIPMAAPVPEDETLKAIKAMANLEKVRRKN